MSRHNYTDFLEEQKDFCLALFEYVFTDDVIEKLSFSVDDEGMALKQKKAVLQKTIFGSRPSQIKIKQSIVFKKIHFPRIDKSPLNYRRILQVMEDIHFDFCEFYGTSLDQIDGEVFFQDCKFRNEWQLQNFNIRKSDPGYVYDECHFKRKISQTKGMVSNPQFNELCKFDKGLELKDIQIKANIFSIDNQPEDNSSLSNFGAMKGEFEFTDCTFSTDQEIFLANAEEASFSLKRCTFEKKFKIRGLEYTKSYEYQQEHKAALESLTFTSCKVANDEDSYLRIGFLKDCEFSLKNLKNQQSSELNIGDCHFSSFELTNFRNLGKFKLFKINIWEGEVSSKFKIDNTSIGNTDFQSLDLTSFSKVFMFDNIFSEIDYTNVQWPKTIYVDQFQKDSDGDVAKKRDSYRMLKNVALKNNDRPQALEFYAQEMENHYEITQWNPSFGDKLTLWFNKFTNQFGMSWARPLVYLVISSLLLYACLYFSLLNNSSGYLILPPWENYWTFLNPMHKVEFMLPKYWNGWTYFIDLLFRVIQALLIYQTIQAFRKFTRPL